MTLSLSGGDIAATITAVGTLVTVVGNLVLQIIQNKQSRANGRKLDENTELTKVAAEKLEEVHAATAVIAESTTGTHKIL